MASSCGGTAADGAEAALVLSFWGDEGSVTTMELSLDNDEEDCSSTSGMFPKVGFPRSRCVLPQEFRCANEKNENGKTAVVVVVVCQCKGIPFSANAIKKDA